MDDFMDYNSKGKLHAPIIGETIIPRLLFADDLNILSLTIINLLQEGIKQVVIYRRDWNLKCNRNKSKILVFMKGGRIKKNER
jgi:hypothetical protein